MIKVICISGKAGSGKDTVGIIMKKYFEENGDRVVLTHYADLLKYICKSFFNWDGNKDKAGRALLQKVGTEMVRSRNENFWVDFVGDMIEYCLTKTDYVIIPDARFPNEIDRLRDRGFDVVHIKIEREDFDSALTIEQQAHESETALDDVIADIVVNNNGDLAQLYKTAKWLTEEITYEY